LKYPRKNQISITEKNTKIPLRWYLIFSVEPGFVIYPVTHLPGKMALRIKMSMETITGARNPRVFSIENKFFIRIKIEEKSSFGFVQLNKLKSLNVERTNNYSVRSSPLSSIILLLHLRKPSGHLPVNHPCRVFGSQSTDSFQFRKLLT